MVIDNDFLTIYYNHKMDEEINQIFNDDEIIAQMSGMDTHNKIIIDFIGKKYEVISCEIKYPQLFNELSSVFRPKHIALELIEI